MDYQQFMLAALVDGRFVSIMNFKRWFVLSVVGILAIMVRQSVFATENDTEIVPIRTLENSTASAVAWSPDGTQLAIGDASGINLYTPDLEFIRHMEQPTEQMKALVWSPDGRSIAASGANDLGMFDRKVPREKKVYIWKAETGEMVTIFDQHKFYVPSIAWSPDSKLVATSSWDRTIRIWNPLTGETEQVIDAPEYPGGGYAREVMSISWSGDNRLVAVIDNVGLFVWDHIDDNPTWLIKIGPRFPPFPNFALWSPDNNSIATGSGIYDIQTQQESVFVNCPGGGDIGGGIAWSPDSKFLATITLKKMYICDPFSDVILVTFEGKIGSEEISFGYQNSLSWHPNGNLVAGAAGDGFVRIWDVSSFVSHEIRN